MLRDNLKRQVLETAAHCLVRKSDYRDPGWYAVFPCPCAHFISLSWPLIINIYIYVLLSIFKIITRFCNFAEEGAQLMYMDLKKALQPRIDIAAREKKDR